MSDIENKQTYEAQFAELEQLVKQLDNASTPIDELAQNVKRGAALIVALNAKLNAVETEVHDAFKALEAAAPKPV